MADDERPGPTHHSAGEDAISVSELLERHRQLDPPEARDDRAGETMPHRPLPVGEAQSPLDSGQLFITELLRREGRLDEPPPPPPRPARSYRPMVAAAALVLVCGVATAGIAALAGDRDDRPDPDEVTPVAVLRGPDALLPDVILLAIHGPAGVAEAAGDAGPDGEGDTDAARSDPEAGDPPGDVLDPETATDPVTGVVTAFFQAAPTSPNDAYELLHETLRGDGIETFNQAWDGVDQVRIDSVRRDGGLVRVALSLVRGDGSTLQVVEEVRVQMDRIVEATLLSAVISR